MKKSSLQTAGVILVFWALSAFSSQQMSRRFTSPFPHTDRLIMMDASFWDVWLIAAGFRAVAADLAWVKLLQYTGGGLEEEKDATQPYGQLRDYTLRVVRIDPFYYRAYLFGSSILAWFRTIQRPAEALEILNEGIQADPRYWAFSLYGSAIAYKNKGDTLKLLNALALAVTQPDCPGTVKVILGDLYKESGRYVESFAVWENLYYSPGAESYQARAREEMEKLVPLIRKGKSS